MDGSPTKAPVDASARRGDPQIGIEPPRPPVLPVKILPVAGLTAGERRAIRSVCEYLVCRVDRNLLAMALRGNCVPAVLQHRADLAEGFGYFAALPEPAVLARIDALIAESQLKLSQPFST